MYERKAILIANSVSYGDRSKNISPSAVEALVRDFARRLNNLGEYSFTVTSIVNKRTTEARRGIVQKISQTAKADSLLLLYYFGHAITENEELYLYFKDSEWPESPTMLKFADLVSWLEHYKIPRVVVVLDCCYAGVVTKSLRILESYGGKYFLMASVTHEQQASVDYSDERPLGRFTKFILDGFSDLRATEAVIRDVSFGSLFKFANEKTREESNQQPYPVDGGLAAETFFKQVTETFIPFEVNHDAPKKSTYKKLFVLGNYLLSKTFSTDEAIYALIERRRPEEFLTPIKSGPRTVKYEPMGRQSFFRYLELCRLLEILHLGEPLQLTTQGKRMMRGNGKLFNRGLFDALVKFWMKHGLSMVDLEDIIGTRIRSRYVPSREGIYRDIYFTKKLRMSRQTFYALLDLTAYVGALSHSTDPTFFLPTK